MEGHAMVFIKEFVKELVKSILNKNNMTMVFIFWVLIIISKKKIISK